MFLELSAEKRGLSLSNVKVCHEIQRAGFKDPGIQE
jgi:hypothetical protein